MSGKMGALDSDNTATQKENSFLLCKVLDLEGDIPVLSLVSTHMLTYMHHPILT